MFSFYGARVGSIVYMTCSEEHWNSTGKVFMVGQEKVGCGP